MERLRDPPEPLPQMLRVWGSQSGPPSLSPVPCDPTGTEPSPVFQPAGGSGRVLPFPRMRISFLPLSGDPGVSTQPWGTGRGSLAGNWGAETPGTALGVPPLPPQPGRDPENERDGFWGGGDTGWRHAAISSSPSLFFPTPGALRGFRGRGEGILAFPETLFPQLGRAGSGDTLHFPSSGAFPGQR